MRKLYKTLSTLLIPLSFLVSAKDNISEHHLMSVSKFTGSCGIIDSLIRFQGSTKMEGGNEFVTRFWALEATRLGMTVEELSEHCNQSYEAYEKLWNAFEN